MTWFGGLRAWFGHQPYMQRVATNFAGVIVGYSGLIVGAAVGEPLSIDDWSFAVAGALLIPVIDRISGSANRLEATKWVLGLAWLSAVLSTLFAIRIYVLIALRKTNYAFAVRFLCFIVSLWYIWLALGMIFDLMLVALEEEKREEQFRDLACRKLRAFRACFGR